ncbi:hypothetical protein [Bradyrhizobium sp.]
MSKATWKQDAEGDVAARRRRGEIGRRGIFHTREPAGATDAIRSNPSTAARSSDATAASLAGSSATASARQPYVYHRSFSESLRYNLNLLRSDLFWRRGRDSLPAGPDAPKTPQNRLSDRPADCVCITCVYHLFSTKETALVASKAGRVAFKSPDHVVETNCTAMRSLRWSKRPAPRRRKRVKGALKAIANVLNAVERRYCDSTTGYDIGGALGGAILLLYVIDDGLRAQKAREKRLGEGEPLQDDFLGKGLVTKVSKPAASFSKQSSRDHAFRGLAICASSTPPRRIPNT